MEDVLDLDAVAQLQRLKDGSLTAEALVRATLARITDVNGCVNAIVSLQDADDLLLEARAKDTAGHTGMLSGLPMAIKDLANAKGLPTTQGALRFADHVAIEDDPFVARLRAAGAIFIGKTNTPEFGLGSHTVNPVFGTTRNAYDQKVSSGGSSGGAAVALATRMVALADGSDMMGSLRNPAGWNNVYGFRPSWGRVPGKSEADPFLHRLSTNGPMARSPADLALLLNVMSGAAPHQPDWFAPQTFHAEDSDITGTRIGWLGDWGGAWPMEPGILELCERGLSVLEDAGAVVDPVTPPFPRDQLWDSWVTLRNLSIASELSPLLAYQHARDQVKEAALWEVDRGAALTAAEITRASRDRAAWFRAAAAVFERFDALVLPTAQVWPFDVGMAYPQEIAGQKMDTYHRWMEVVIPASLIGLPALAIPAGFGGQGLPMGLQLIGCHGDDQALLTLAQAYHRATYWPQRYPPKM